MNSASRHRNNAFVRLITLIVLMSFSFANFSHTLHSDVESQQVETLDCKLCQQNFDDSKNELFVTESFIVQFVEVSTLKSSLLGYHQFYIIPALRAPPVNSFNAL